MHPEARQYLQDIEHAVSLIEEFTAGRSFSEYEHDAMLRSAVERQFITVGEAMGLLTRSHPAVAARITEARRIVDFRNFLAHGYVAIDDRLVWGVVEDRVPTLRRDVEALLAED